MSVKRRLANALIEICESKPLDDVTVTEIAKKANLTRQVFYKYFMDKYELANWIHVDDHYFALQREKGFTDDWFEFVSGWLSAMKKHKNFYQNIYYSVSDREFQRTIMNHVIDFYTEIIEIHNNDKLDKETDFSLKVYCYGGFENISKWVLGGMKESPEEFCRLLYVSMPSNIQKVLVDKPFPKSVIEEIYKFSLENVKKPM